MLRIRIVKFFKTEIKFDKNSYYNSMIILVKKGKKEGILLLIKAIKIVTFDSDCMERLDEYKFFQFIFTCPIFYSSKFFSY